MDCLFLGASGIAAPMMECVELSHRQALREASLVFKGKVVKVESIDDPDDPADRVPIHRPSSGAPRLVTFAIERFWKGHGSRTIRVFHFLQPSQGTGYAFKIGGEYIVYTQDKMTWAPVVALSKGEPVYELGLCAARIRTDVAAEARRLGRGTAPVE